MNSIIDWLTYRSYESNRLRRPDIPYFKWRKVYQDAIAFEEIFENHHYKLENEVMYVDFNE